MKRQPKDKPAATRRAAFIASLVKIVDDMVPPQRAKEAGFDAADWVARWLRNPMPALGGKAPNPLLKDAEGRAIVLRTLHAYENGAYV